jgi:hypothetical protein
LLHADVPGSSLPSLQSQKSSFTDAIGKLRAPPSHANVAAAAPAYAVASDGATPRGTCD